MSVFLCFSLVSLSQFGGVAFLNALHREKSLRWKFNLTVGVI